MSAFISDVIGASPLLVLYGVLIYEKVSLWRRLKKLRATAYTEDVAS